MSFFMTHSYRQLLLLYTEMPVHLFFFLCLCLFLEVQWIMQIDPYIQFVFHKQNTDWTNLKMQYECIYNVYL